MQISRRYEVTMGHLETLTETPEEYLASLEGTIGVQPEVRPD